MAKIDEIKEFIGFLKALFITTIVIMSSLVDILVILLLFGKILKEIKSLRDL